MDSVHPAMHMYGSVHTDRHVRVYLLCMDAQQCLVPSVYLHMYMLLQVCTVPVSFSLFPFFFSFFFSPFCQIIAC